MQGQRIIINGDDLGLTESANAGIAAAYRAGVLSSTSLMISGDNAEDGIEFVRETGLSVGLHITFSDVKPVLPPDEIPLLHSNGRFPHADRTLHRALRSVAGRAQVRAELNAQFRAFHLTGLRCDHVNVHRNVHLHPVLALMLFTAAKQWQVNAVRLPWSPPTMQTARVTDGLRLARHIWLRHIGRSYNLYAPMRSMGRIWNVDRLVNCITTLPLGTSEIYCHPVLLPEGQSHDFAGDLPALLSYEVMGALSKVSMCSYNELYQRP